MSHKSAKSVFVSCPGCHLGLAPARSGRKAVRRVGPDKAGPFLVRVGCPRCGRLIVRTVLH